MTTDAAAGRDTEVVRISAKSDYALRALLELAAAGGELRTTEVIAQAQGIPPTFLATVMGELRRAGLVRSHRGAEGGYTLARAAAETTVADVIRAVDGPLASVHGHRPQDLDYEGAAQALTPLWVAVRASLRQVLEQVTLAHLASGRLPRAVARLTEDDDAWQNHC
jgi:Rrf2 family protein